MGTRALIKIEGSKVAAIYKHWDGDPDSTKPFLDAFNKRFAEERGDDPQYKFAQLLRETIRSGEKYHLDMSEFTGWGVVDYNADVGQEYTYLLKTDGSVQVQEV